MLIIWLALWFLCLIKISIILFDSELAVQDKIVWYVKISCYLFLFWYLEILDYLIDKNLWTIKWYLKFKT
jgi:hypothetical protein